MPVAQPGDIVKVYCAGRLPDGSEFALSPPDDPLEIFVGHGDLLPDLDQDVAGMSPGQTRTVSVPKERGYGPRRADLVQVVDRDLLPQGIEPKVGQRIRIPRPGYDVLNAVIVEVNDTHVTLDGNHPLAGRDVQFTVTLVEIVSSV